MTYWFYNRLVLSGAVSAGLLGDPNPDTGLVDDVSSVVLADDGPNGIVELSGPADGKPLQAAMELRLIGRDFPTFESAYEAGCRWRNHLTIAFAHYLVGIKIGSADDPTEPLEPGYGSPYYQVPAPRVLRDEPGLFVAGTGKQFGRMGSWAEGYVMQGVHGLVTYTIPWITSRHYELSPQRLLAYSLVHATYFDDNPETTFILLVTAIEALLPPREDNPKEVAGILAALQTALAAMEVEENLRKSIAGVLEDKKYDTIVSRGKRLVACLGTERFGGQKPKDYFYDRYDERSRLVHPGSVRLTQAELRERLPELRRFVLALLGVQVFGERMPELWTEETVEGS
ncbi:hypothetical protein [Mycolicibacterium sp.]|uniref:hypothetical protein n=1 Tax=Mycolicibacterium sp. TaxID=2320850 RepID=UPI0037C72DFA